jgi:hypothetical protein
MRNSGEKIHSFAPHFVPESTCATEFPPARPPREFRKDDILYHQLFLQLLKICVAVTERDRMRAPGIILIPIWFTVGLPSLTTSINPGSLQKNDAFDQIS